MGHNIIQKVPPSFKMAENAVCIGAVGFIQTKLNNVFEECKSFCLAENIDYHSDYYMFEDRNPDKDFTLYFMYLFSRKLALHVLEYMNKFEQKYIFVNLV